MADLWQLTFLLADHAHGFAEVVDGAVEAETISIHRDHDDDPWQVMMITMTEPHQDLVNAAVNNAEAILGVKAKDISLIKLPKTDWLVENRKSFPPLDIGSFWVYGNYVDAPVPDGKIGLKIDAGEAFGSGTHATTHGCVTMLETYCPKSGPLKIADIGCGSGILAMAAGKLRPDTDIIAVDNDPIAVQVARQNCDDNNVNFIRTAVSDGYDASLVKASAPFDIILANILPKPLMAMAKDAAACLQDGGILILSGLMEMHQDEVVLAHEDLGLKLLDEMVFNEWVTLVMTTRSAR